MAKGKGKAQADTEARSELPDLEIRSSAELNEPDVSKLTTDLIDHVIRRIHRALYSLEPRLALNKTPLVTRYRISLEQRHDAFDD